jgi:hypothetical protein
MPRLARLFILLRAERWPRFRPADALDRKGVNHGWTRINTGAHDKNLHVVGRAALVRRPRIQGRAATLPYQEVEDFCPAPLTRMGFLLSVSIREIPVRHSQATADVAEFLPLRLCDSARDRLFWLVGLVFRSFNLWQALAV